MHIEIRTDTNIQGGESLAAHAKTVVEHAMSHVTHHVSRVEVHLTDANGGKGGPTDKHCTMEARIEGRQPIGVSDQAATVADAMTGAAGKLRRAVESVVSKMTEQR